jgi:HEAT repeat protein
MTGLHTMLLLVLLAGPGVPGRTGQPAGVPDTPDIPRLRELLYHRQQPQEQSQAAFLLVESQHADAGEAIREALRRWDRPDVFQALAAAIRLRRDARFEAQLLKALTSEQTPIRQAATEALPRLENPNLIRKLLSLAEDSATPVTARQSAATALGGCMQKSAAVALLTLLSSDSQLVRQSAATALENLTGQTYGLNALLWQDWWQQHKDLTDEQWLVNRTAFFADRTRRLQDELQRAEGQILQLHKELFQKVPPAERVTHLGTLVGNDNPAIRAQVINWIAELLAEADAAAQQKLAELLLKLSDDGVEGVQRQAVLAMEKLNDPRVFERLLTLVGNGSLQVRAAAARSLGRYRADKNPESTQRNMRAIEALEKALNDPALPVVVEAAASLGAMGAPEAAPVLARFLHHPSDNVRQAAAQALEQASNPSILPDLYQGLYDPVAAVRFSLVGALGKVAQGGGLREAEVAGVVKRLTEVLLRDSDPGVRSRGATVIGDLGTPGDLQVLWERVNATEDNRVQLKAWTAFLEILSRTQSYALLTQWDQLLAAKAPTRRVELLSELRTRWLKNEAVKQHLDALTGLLIEAQLQQRKWQPSLQLALELVRKDGGEAELQKRLRWLLVAGQMALEDKKPDAAMEMLKAIEDLLPRSRDLAPEFDLLRTRAQKSTAP